MKLTDSSEQTKEKHTASLDLATEVLKAIEAGDNSVSLMRGMLCGVLLLNQQLHGIRNACEDIAAGVLFPDQPERTSGTLATAADLLKRFINGETLIKYECVNPDQMASDNQTALIAAHLLAIAESINGGSVAHE